ncbi:hypothetical protein DMB92_01380 [Campylobacter sp. MIT 99-7217]|uniref:hypothetical protein n=1 Tax=Campylobacter sp. MIT 99-7217 TaxID=535091 RepID=UPI00115777C1|nr:hypothetical protein [Campylobacter sp. MIT 99-7217]TQR34641.1 hypothetical protein DMB92_01380 [Campylobacter sp. MIT 99-7217]
MLFDELFRVLIIYLALIIFFALLGLKFSKKAKLDEEQKRVPKKIYKICPCKRAVESGLMSKLCIYSGAICFMLSLTNLTLIANLNLNNFIVLFLAMLCTMLGWFIKND